MKILQEFCEGIAGAAKRDCSTRHDGDMHALVVNNLADFIWLQCLSWIQANALGFSRSERPTQLSISDRIRSSTVKPTFAPSSVGSMCTRNGRLPNGVFTTSTIAAATAEGSASGGTVPANAFCT